MITKVMFIGDSMTKSQSYIDHVVNKLYNVKTVGTRTYNNDVFQEGRGGWAYKTYTQQKPPLYSLTFHQNHHSFSQHVQKVPV